MSRARILPLAALLAIPFSPAAGRAATPPTIVFAADRTPSVSGEIYRLRPNGRRIDLSRSPYQDTHPVVSTDGKRVAFVSDRSGASSVYEVGINGRGLVHIGPSLTLPGEGGEPALAWQPGGRLLALVGSTGRTGMTMSLWILRRGRAPLRLLRSKHGISGPWWSPDGRVLTASPSPGVVRAFSATGHPLWKVKGGCCGTWSPQGLLAVAADHGAAVYDETGRLRFEFRLPTRTPDFSWSPDGRYLAVSWSNSSDWLEVRTATGSLALRQHVPWANIAWANDSTVVAGNPECLNPACRNTVQVDVGTRKARRASNRWLDPLSPDRKLAIVTPARKPGFAIGVARPGGGPTTTYARIGACVSYGSRIPAASSLQFVGRSRSVVYQSWSEFCDEPFSNLYSIASDGGAVKRLTNVPAQETQPTLSPDGREIAYVWASATGLTCAGCSDGIRLVNADGKGSRTLTNPQNCTFDDSPTWSPDGTTILYSEAGCDSPPELYTLPAAGGTPHDLGLAGKEPTWGPSRIAYMAGGVWTANPDGSDPARVAKNGSHPAWSADGRLAYLMGSNGTTVVVGSTQTQLPFTDVTSLAWSPDGTRFVVTAQRSRTAAPDVYTVKTDGTDPVRLTKNYDALGATWR